MNQAPYSFAEAKRLCEEFNFIPGKQFKKNAEATISALLIVPHDPVSKNRFIMLYLLLNDAKEILAKDYSGAQYDVIVVSGAVKDNTFQYEDLYCWLVANDYLHDVADLIPGCSTCI